MLLEVGHQAREELRIQIVTGGNAEGARGRFGVKLPSIAEQAFGRTQNIGGRLHHALAHFCRLHLRPRSHQQRVARQLTQPAQ